jgi:hypothetical protein
MIPHQRVPGPYDDGCAADNAFQLACNGCTIADLLALASTGHPTVEHILGSVTKGTRPIGKVASLKMGGETWRWGLNLTGGQVGVGFTRKNPQLHVKIINLIHS